MLLSFRAIEVSLEEDADVYRIGMLKNLYDPSEYVIIDKSRVNTDYEISLGFDKVYIEVDDQGWASFGGIDEVRIAREKISLEISEAAAAKIRGFRKIEISFELDDGKYAEFTELIKKIFDDSETKVSFEN